MNLTPVDLPHLEWILPHQIRVWSSQVDRIILTAETLRSPGRYGLAWDERVDGFDRLLQKTANTDAKVTICPVDYSPQAVAEVARRFKCIGNLPLKDMHGAPFYGYLYGLHSTGVRYVLHADSDILFGGGAQTWMREAIAMLNRQPDVLFSGPLPGPPTRDGQPRWDVLKAAAASQRYSSLATLPEPNVLQFCHMSTRCFLVDLALLARHAVVPEDTRPPKFSKLSPGPAPLEVSLSRMLREHSLLRRDMLGTKDGMWSIHPPFRTEDFIRSLPQLILRVESGDVPDAQRGDYDLNDSMVDWSRPRRAAARQRSVQKFRRAAGTLAERTGIGRQQPT